MFYPSLIGPDSNKSLHLHTIRIITMTRGRAGRSCAVARESDVTGERELCVIEPWCVSHSTPHLPAPFSFSVWLLVSALSTRGMRLSKTLDEAPPEFLFPLLMKILTSNMICFTHHSFPLMSVKWS